MSSRFVREALAGWNGAWSPTRPPRGMDRVRRFLARQPQVTANDIADLEHLRRSDCGSALYATVVLASVLDSFDVWSASETAHLVVPLDLAQEVRSVGLSAGRLQRATDDLGVKPSGHLADDARVQELFDMRSKLLADRTRALVERVSAFRAYFDGVALMQRDLEALRWVAEHGDPNRSEFEAQVADELRTVDLDAARDAMRTATDQMVRSGRQQ